jgi:hypothetical protein
LSLSLTGKAPAGAFTTVAGAVQPAGFIAANASARPPLGRPLFISFAGWAVSSIDWCRGARPPGFSV